MKVITDTITGIVTVDGVQVYPIGPVPIPIHTCPSGWHWDDSKQACVADVTGGNMNDKVSIATILSNQIGGTGMYGLDGHMVRQDEWFLVNAELVGWTTGTLMISVLDMAQGVTGGQPQATIYPVDLNGNLMKTVSGSKIKNFPCPIPMSDGWQGSVGPLPVGYRYLLLIHQAGSAVPLRIDFQR